MEKVKYRQLLSTFMLCTLLQVLSLYETRLAVASENENREDVNSFDVSSACVETQLEFPFNEILYASNREGNWELYLHNLTNGSEPENLTNNPGSDLNPQITSSGETIVFYSDRDGDNDIYSLDLPSRQLTQLTRNDASDYDPTFSPDGTTIAYKSNEQDGYGDIYTMNSDGTNPVNITSSMDSTEEWKPTFSADGSQIVFTSRLIEGDPNFDELYRYDIATGEILRLTDNDVPDWYPDINANNQIIFISKEETTDPDAIYTMTIDGSDRRQITNFDSDSDDPEWVSNSSFLFVRYIQNSFGIFAMDSEGANFECVFDSPGDELSPIPVPVN